MLQSPDELDRKPPRHLEVLVPLTSVHGDLQNVPFPRRFEILPVVQLHDGAGGIRSRIFDMNSFAAVVMIEKERCSPGVPARQAVQIPASDMMGLFFRKILNGRFVDPPRVVS